MPGFRQTPAPLGQGLAAAPLSLCLQLPKGQIPSAAGEYSLVQGQLCHGIWQSGQEPEPPEPCAAPGQ